MLKVCLTIPWDTRTKVKYLLLVGVAIASPAVMARAQNSVPLPSAPSANAQQGLPDAAPQSGPARPDSGAQPEPGTQPGAEPAPAEPLGQAGSGSRSGSSFHPRAGQSDPFGLPRSISKTTAGGVKFQLALPRLSLAGGGRSMGGQASPLDSGGAQGVAGGGSAMLPSAGGSTHSPDGVGGGVGGGLPRGGGGQPGGLSVSMPGKSSMFKVNLSMKEVIGGSFVGSSGGGGGSGGGEGPTAGAGAGGFGLSGAGGAGGASDFGGAGGTRGGGGRGSGAKMSLGLRF